MFCDISQQGLLRFSGEDARLFLHNQLSCDVNTVTVGRSTYGSYCTPKGRMLASFLLWRSEQGFFMQLPSSLREGIQKQISKFILRSKVMAADASGDWTIIGIDSMHAAALVQRAVGGVPRDVHEVIYTQDAMVIRLPGDRYEIIVGRDRSPVVVGSLSDGAGKADQEHWEWLDIRAGVPVILPSTQEEFVPQMVNLDLIGGVSFEKGCYPGQEIVSRMHYRGTLKQRMYLANIASGERPQPADKLYSAHFGEQACGTIVNAARSPEGGHDVLAVIQIASTERGEVHWKSLDGPALKLMTLPYPVTA